MWKEIRRDARRRCHLGKVKEETMVGMKTEATKYVWVEAKKAEPIM
jgi:hypothetical protein